MLAQLVSKVIEFLATIEFIHYLDLIDGHPDTMLSLVASRHCQSDERWDGIKQNVGQSDNHVHFSKRIVEQTGFRVLLKQQDKSAEQFNRIVIVNKNLRNAIGTPIGSNRRKFIYCKICNDSWSTPGRASDHVNDNHVHPEPSCLIWKN